MSKLDKKVKCGNTKQSISKSEKSQLKKNVDKKNSDSNAKKFAYISPESMSAIADSMGIEFSEEAKCNLAEDVSYKLREIITSAAISLRNNRRQKLLTSDIIRILEVSNAPAVYGHGVNHELDFINVPETDIFVIKDAEVDIVKMALAKTEYVKLGEEYVKGFWVLPDPPVEKPPESQLNSSAPAADAPKSEQSDAPQMIVSKPQPQFINYYLQVARVVIGGSEPHLKVALADLKKNCKITQLTQYFLNLIALTVNKLQRHFYLTDALLRTIKALVYNTYINPSAHLAVNRVVNALLVIAIEPRVATRCDDLALRRKAADLIAKVIVTWNIELKQQMDIIRRLLQLLLDKNISLKSYYGALVTLIALGSSTLELYFWPNLERYLALLEAKEPNEDILHIHGMILIAAERLYLKCSKAHISPEELKKLAILSNILYEHFGEAVLLRRTPRMGKEFLLVKKQARMVPFRKTSNVGNLYVCL